MSLFIEKFPKDKISIKSILYLIAYRSRLAWRVFILKNVSENILNYNLLLLTLVILDKMSSFLIL
jgi:hypothetical protein